MPNYGVSGRPTYRLGDWLLGGERKRRILECLSEAPDDGWSAEGLSDHLGIGPATVYEAFRALRRAALLHQVKPGRYELGTGTDLAEKLRALVIVLKDEGADPVDRPTRDR